MRLWGAGRDGDWAKSFPAGGVNRGKDCDAHSRKKFLVFTDIFCGFRLMEPPRSRG